MAPGGGGWRKSAGEMFHQPTTYRYLQGNDGSRGRTDVFTGWGGHFAAHRKNFYGPDVCKRSGRTTFFALTRILAVTLQVGEDNIFDSHKELNQENGWPKTIMREMTEIRCSFTILNKQM